MSAGGPVQVPCSADGKPTPRIEWFRITDDGSNEFIGNELNFVKVRQSDTGYYECRASNGVDEELSSRIRLDVLGK